MADISLCSDNAECSQRKTCYRVKAPQNPYWQSWSTFYDMALKNNNICDMYITNSDGRRKEVDVKKGGK